MDHISSEIITAIMQLLPGFLAAWVFHGLSAHPKMQSEFERVIEALIYNVIIRAGTFVFAFFATLVGRTWISVAPWNTNAELTTSVALAFVLGIILARSANDDIVHKLLRGPLGIGPAKWIDDLRRHKWGRCALWLWGPWTRRTSHPSEWFSVLSTNPCWIILHLKGDRRLYGWPYEWPDHSDRGQFVIEEPEWIDDNGTRIALQTVRFLLIPATEVEMIEFLKERLPPMDVIASNA